MDGKVESIRGIPDLLHYSIISYKFIFLQIENEMKMD